MKKLKLSLSNMEGVEVLTREQLKKVIGGLEDGSGGSGGGQETCYGCKCPRATEVYLSDLCGYDAGIVDLCTNGGAVCGYWVCGNPGVNCGLA